MYMRSFLYKINKIDSTDIIVINFPTVVLKYGLIIFIFGFELECIGFELILSRNFGLYPKFVPYPFCTLVPVTFSQDDLCRVRWGERWDDFSPRLYIHYCLRFLYNH